MAFVCAPNEGVINTLFPLDTPFHFYLTDDTIIEKQGLGVKLRVIEMALIMP